MTRRRARRRRRDARKAAAAVVTGVVLAAVAHAAGHAPAAGTPAVAPGGAAAKAIAFVRAQLGCPYVWGGTGPCQAGFDCSGLVMQAWAAAGVAIPRTSQQQWAAGPQVAVPRPGDLVFFAGGDGTPAAPGHVGLVIGPHLMIEAYAAGYPVRVSPFGTPAAAPGDGDPVGFTDPLRGAGR